MFLHKNRRTQLRDNPKKILTYISGQDAEPVQVDGLGASWIPLPYGTIGDLNATEDNSSYRMSVCHG